eukprot:3583832-Alexandrium_andersonii.AAC.1
MSASLVGSEMCIRDSCQPVFLEIARRVARMAGEGGARGERAGVLWAMPVSYTHLTLPTICSV